jgi:hypothetical protein
VGDEIRSCWEAWPGALDPPLTIAPAQPTTGPRKAEPREFIEVGVLAAEATLATAEVAPIVRGPVPMPAIGEPGWSLWGDVEG